MTLETQPMATTGIYQELPLQCDVAVLGAGPAGAATALALCHLRPNAAIVLIDGGRSAKHFQGTSLEREAQQVLQRLNVWELFTGNDPSAALGTRAAWGSPELLPHEFFYTSPRQGWRLERQQVTTLLRFAAAAEGVTLARADGLRGVQTVDDGFELDLFRSRLSARFVVDATGRIARLAQNLGARKVRYDRLVGVSVSLAGRTAAFDRTDILVEAHREGWWYAAPEGKNQTFVSFFTDVDLARGSGIGEAEAWHALFASTEMCSELEGLEARTKPAVQAVNCHRLDRVAGEGWLAVGKAAAALDPLIPGLRRALAGGLDAAQAVDAFFAGRRTRINRYQHGVFQQFDDLLASRRKLYEREIRWPQATFWSRRREQPELDRDLLLSYSPNPERSSRLESLDMHLSQRDLWRLCDLCTAPRLVSAVVKAFRRDTGSMASERRVLLALQYLVEHQIIDAE